MDITTIRAFFMWCSVINGAILISSSVILVFGGSSVFRMHSSPATAKAWRCTNWPASWPTWVAGMQPTWTGRQQQCHGPRRRRLETANRKRPLGPAIRSRPHGPSSADGADHPAQLRPACPLFSACVNRGV